MLMNDKRRIGGCLCGAVRYGVLGESVWKSLCYCESCCRAAGAPVVAWAGFKKDKFEILKGSLKKHESSPKALRGFCGECGTTLTYEKHPDCDDEWRDGSKRDEIYITTVSLDNPLEYPPDEQVYLHEKVPWLHVVDDLPHHEHTSDTTACCE